MKLISHLPPILQGVREYSALCAAVDEELDTLRAGIEAVRRNLVISTAEEVGLSRWEAMLDLPSSGSVEERRVAVLSRTVRDLPYSLAKVEERLAGLVGESGYTLSLSEMTLSVTLSLEAKGAYAAVCEMLRNLIPANIGFTVSVKLAAHAELGALTHADLSAYTHESIRNEVATGDNRTL